MRCSSLILKSQRTVVISSVINSFTKAFAIGVCTFSLISCGGGGGGGGAGSGSAPTASTATLQSIAVTPSAPSVGKAATIQLTATGTYSDGTSKDITSSVTWSSGTTSVATVNASGLATGVAVGTSTIKAASGTISGNTTLTVTAASFSLAVLHSFSGGTADGNSPHGNLILASDGNFYGMTSGGTSNGGTVFKITSGGTFTLLHSFALNGVDGAGPFGSLIQASDGAFYGVTAGGGSGGTGTVFKMSPAGVVTVIHNFMGGPTDGIYPNGDLIQASDGNLYGMTMGGGAGGSGTVFRITTAGVLTVLHSFAAGNNDGATPKGSLIQASDGNLYGMTPQAVGSNGVANQNGVVFKITTAGTFTLLHSFAGGAADGAGPLGSLIQASDGNLYGMTMGGGAGGNGTVFKITTGGVFSLLYSFITQGALPQGSLIQARDGNLYGMTPIGGNTLPFKGAVFSITTGGTFNLLHSFIGGATDGASPFGSLIQAPDGSFYGMTSAGGSSNFGTIFNIK